MSNLNDLKYAGLGGPPGALQQLENEFFEANGITGNQSQHDFLDAQGIGPGSLNDRWIEYWGGGGGPTAAFHALTPDPLTYEIKGVLTGTGGLSTTHAEPIHAADFEGVYREFAANEPVWEGGRVVTNGLTRSSEFDHADWGTDNLIFTSGQSDPVGGTDAYLVTNNGSVSYFWQAGTISGDYVTSIWIKRKTGTGPIRLYSGSAYIALLVTSEWQRFVVNGTWDGGNANRFYLRMDVSGDEICVYGAQQEATAGRSDQTIPSEYIPTTSAAVTKVFANENGNTVSSNVVTEATGAALTEAPYLKYQPAATNSCLYSRDLTDAAWTSTSITTTYDQTGLDGSPNAASLLDDSNTGSYGTEAQGVTITAGQTTTAVVYIKKDSDETRFPAIRLAFTSASGTPRESYQINTKTGATNQVVGVGTYTSDIEVVDDGDWWKVLFEITETAASATSVWITIYAANGTSWGTQSAAATGSIIVGNVELHLNKTIAEVRGLGPIFTTSAAVSTDATVYSFDIANHDDDKASYYLEAMPTGEHISADLLLSLHTTTNSTLFRRNSGTIVRGDYRNTSGSNDNVLLGATLVDDTENKWAIVYDDSTGEFNINLDNSWGTKKTNYQDHGPTQTNITVGRSNSVAWKYRNLRRYDIASYEDGKSIIDGLMEDGGISSPEDIAGLFLWLDGTDTSTMWQDDTQTTPVTANGQDVGTWRNKASGGSSEDFTQATAVNKPKYETGVQNGLAALDFDGNQVLARATGITDFTNDFTIFAVYTQDTGETALHAVFVTDTATASSRFAVYADPRNSPRRLVFVPGDNYVDLLSQQAPDVWKLTSADVDQDGTGTFPVVRGWLDGALQGSTNATEAMTANGFRIGKQSTSLDLSGHIGEILVYDSVLSDSDRQKVETYLKNRWGIS